MTILGIFDRFNKKILISTAAIIVSASIGIPVAITSRADTNVPAVSSNSVTSSVSTTSGVVVAPTKSTTSTASTVKAGTVGATTSAGSTYQARAATPARGTTVKIPDKASMIARENTRHQNMLASIDDQYATQISEFQNKIASYQAEGVRDTTAEMAVLKAQTDSDYAQYQYYSKNNDSATNEGVDYKQIFWNQYNDDLNKMYLLQHLKSEYDNLVKAQSMVSFYQSLKQPAINEENSRHDNLLREIN